MSKFNLGRLYMTKAVNELVADDEQFAKDINNALEKYVNCDWGTLEYPEDIKLNEKTIETEIGNIQGVYETSHGTVWIMTDMNKHENYYVTTILFPSEY